MIYEQRAILSLVAMGRITGAEAERLIIAWKIPARHNPVWQSTAWQDVRDWVWIALACVGAWLLQTHPHLSLDAIGNLLHGVATHGTRVLHTAASIGSKKMGGSI